jgi:hemerythrin-like domain-containing protein
MSQTLFTPQSPSQTARVAASGAPRVDLYAPIHKALRSFMSDTLCRVGRIDVDDAEDMQQALAQCDALLALCENHVHHENEFMHPAIEARQPAGSRRIAHEHEEHLQTIAELRDEIAALRAAAADAAPALALRLYRHLALFVAENFQHMHIEETAHNTALWTHYSDTELMQLHGRLMASIDPREHLLVGRWMVPALTPAERAAVVGGMKAEAPPEAFLGLLAHIRPHVDAKGWAKLARDVGLPQQAAFEHSS